VNTPALVREIPRKLFHLLAGSYIILYWWLPREACLIVLILLGVMFGLAEWVRLTQPSVNAAFLKLFGAFQRPEESQHPTAIVWGIAGSALVILLFQDRAIVISALGFLVFGDAAAALCGKAWGKHRWPWTNSKSIEGSLGYAIVCSLWAGLFLPWPLAITGACMNAVLETVPLPGNDNFWIPLLAAVSLTGLTFLI